ncbi:MAG: hypothetical protein JWN86_3026 [Planctomycetota bacterium]|nr:hypothetical protein [Planctomycetota bacterium]
MARKASRSASESQEMSEPQGGQEGHGKLTKSEAIRRALADGVEQPVAGVAYIRSHFGIVITPRHFSAVKATERQKGGIRVRLKPGRKPKAAPGPAVEGYLAPPPRPSASAETDLLAAMEAMKPLVAALGADKVKRIVDLLG